PLPRGWLPRPSPKKRFPILYPREDRTLLACESVPLCRRVMYAFLHREGSRRGEVGSMQVRDIDLDNRTVSLDVNKTDHARFWKLGDGVAEALDAWFAFRGGVKSEDFVFIDEN